MSVPSTESLVVHVTGAVPNVVLATFALDQPGASAFVGFFEHDGAEYALKLLKTRDVRQWFATQDRFREPSYVRAVRALSITSNPFNPTPDLWPTIESDNLTCQRWLCHVARDTAQDILRRVIQETDVSSTRALVDDAFGHLSSLDLAPRTSVATRIQLGPDGRTRAYALVQESAGKTARSFSRTLQVRRRLDGGARRLQAQMLVLLALAIELAATEGLGLDLTPRFRGRLVSVPNILVRADEEHLMYMDYFGFARMDQTSGEAGLFRALYGDRGVAMPLARRIYRELACG